MAVSIQYLHHSGFAVVTQKYFLIFDYDGTGLPADTLTPERVAGRNLFVFVSHSHTDHFSPEIFEWKRQYPSLRLILSDDIPIRAEAEAIGPGQTRDFDGLTVRTIASTDEGVAFLVKADGLCLYHAGDCNWWHWSGETKTYLQYMARCYKEQINELRRESIDIAFVPVDPRLEDSYAWGLDFFMRTVGAALVFPMHFWDDETLVPRLRSDPAVQPYRDKIAQIQTRGQWFSFSPFTCQESQSNIHPDPQ